MTERRHNIKMCWTVAFSHKCFSDGAPVNAPSFPDWQAPCALYATEHRCRRARRPHCSCGATVRLNHAPALPQILRRWRASEYTRRHLWEVAPPTSMKPFQNTFNRLCFVCAANFFCLCCKIFEILIYPYPVTSLDINILKRFNCVCVGGGKFTQLSASTRLNGARAHPLLLPSVISGHGPNRRTSLLRHKSARWRTLECHVTWRTPLLGN